MRSDRTFRTNLEKQKKENVGTKISQNGRQMAPNQSRQCRKIYGDSRLASLVIKIHRND